MSEEFTERQYLEARKQFLYKIRKQLNWTTQETAKKLKVMEIEYVNFENGLTKDLVDYEWEDIQYFLTNHLNRLKGK
ncbi:hypothetical protein [Petroclostridium sp. X23]|jgi:transcriptional regulator with XRE-family HTH domain|uniref:hypothetical protein n=1 Tax=Petroclostridium sp. X23 TaxID=3045146 RepID=UPI0024AD2FA4|nr:hypothetical protein [Petroclostridium sp. X23]WHH60799.1 hypothetical protein QKW49_08910 [Petroclostridium sp. X23]